MTTHTTHKRIALRAAEALDELSKSQPETASLLRKHITSLRAENARYRARAQRDESTDVE
ncbi:MAG: hypothetical protein ACOH14_07645 [Rhodoglobus sp.]